jgi:hypothetical protein
MLNLARWLAPLSLVFVTACGGAQRGGPGALAEHCEATHRLQGDDTLETRIDRLVDGWLVSLNMRVRLAEGAAPIAVRGLGRITRSGSELRCQVVEADGLPGAPRFDEAVCLDEFESVAYLLAEAEQAARPGETVVQEVSLRARRRPRTRSRMARGVVAFRERAEVTRDPEGRVVRVVRSASGGGREEITVSYPAGVRGRCLVAE